IKADCTVYGASMGNSHNALALSATLDHAMLKQAKARGPFAYRRNSSFSITSFGSFGTWLLALVLSFELCPLGFGADATQRPNIIVILADDLGAKELSCYGNKEHKTPNLDKLAATGV